MDTTGLIVVIVLMCFFFLGWALTILPPSQKSHSTHKTHKKHRPQSNSNSNSNYNSNSNSNSKNEANKERMRNPAGTGFDFSAPRKPLAETLQAIKNSFAATKAKGSADILRGIRRGNLDANHKKSWVGI